RRERDVMRAQLIRAGVRVFEGCASFEGAHQILVDDGVDRHHLEAERIAIAVGTRPGLPTGIEVDHATVLTSDDVLALPRLPRSLVVVGAGIIGVEYATIFGALGVHVTLVDKRPEVLEMVDREVLHAFAYHARERGVVFRLGEEVERLVTGGPGEA